MLDTEPANFVPALSLALLLAFNTKLSSATPVPLDPAQVASGIARSPVQVLLAKNKVNGAPPAGNTAAVQVVLF